MTGLLEVGALYLFAILAPLALLPLVARANRLDREEARARARNRNRGAERMRRIMGSR